MSPSSAAPPESKGYSSATRFSRALGATVTTSGFGYASQLLSIFALPLYLTTLGAAGYGLIVTVMALMGYIGFADAGLSWGSMILIAQADGRGSRAEIAHIVRHSIGLAACSGLLAIAMIAGILGAARAGHRLPMFTRHPEADLLIAIAGVQLVVTLQLSVFYNLFTGLQEGYWTAAYQGLGRLLGIAAAMWVAWRTRSVAGVMLVQFAFVAATGIVAAVHVWLRHPWAFSSGSWFDKSQYLAQLRIGAKNFLLQIGRTLAGTAPTLGISSIVGPAAVPLYSVPTTLLTSFFMPINSWNANMQSAYGEACMSGSRDWTRRAYRQTLERSLLIGGSGVAIFLALGDRFVRLWTHGRLWLDTSMAVSVAAIVVLYCLVAGSEYLLTGMNCHRRAAVAQIAGGVLSILLVPLTIKWLGLGSVGIGVVVATLGTSGWVLWREIRHHLGPESFPKLSFLARICATVALSWGAARWVGRAGPPDVRSVLVHLAAGGAVGLVGFAAVASALRLVAGEDIVKLWRRVFRRFAPAGSK
jgi:O-antigen/teichoic acid export membrane protein